MKKYNIYRIDTSPNGNFTATPHIVQSTTDFDEAQRIIKEKEDEGEPNYIIIPEVIQNETEVSPERWGDVCNSNRRVVEDARNALWDAYLYIGLRLKTGYESYEDKAKQELTAAIEKLKSSLSALENIAASTINYELKD